MADENPINDIGKINWKSWYASKTFWGILIFVLSSGANIILHKTIDPALQSQIVDALTQLGSVVGAGLTAWGLRTGTADIGKPK